MTQKEQTFFYLKVNKFNHSCIQHWINIVNEYDADFCFVCDKENLKNKILSVIKFKDNNIKFITSDRNKALELAKRMQLSLSWYNAACAHLTTFLHAKENNICDFWNIDADDTFMSADPKNIAKYLKEVADYTDKSTIDIISFDMHHSSSNMSHSSFGIVYTKNAEKWLNKFEKFDTEKWNYEKQCYTWCPSELNIDWFMTWLKDTNQLNIETFYIDNLYFSHQVVEPLLLSGLLFCYYSDNKINYPIVQNVYKLSSIGVSYVPIAQDCIKFDFNLSKENSLDFFVKYYFKLEEKLAGMNFLFTENQPEKYKEKYLCRNK